MHVVLHGVSIEIELKAPTGKPSELQLKNLDIISASGSHGYILVESKATAIRLREWISEKYPQYSNVKVIDFETFKKICNSLKWCFFKKHIDILNNIVYNCLCQLILVYMKGGRI